MDEKTCMEPLKLAGRLIMENGGETFRVEETVQRMGEAFGLRNVESFAVPSGVFVSFQCRDGSTQTAVLRVKRNDTDLERVDAVNRVSRQVAEGKLGPQQALEALEGIEKGSEVQTRVERVLASGVCAAGFAGMFGGGALDIALAVLVGALIEGVAQLFSRYHLKALVTLLFGAFLATFLPDMIQSFLPGRSLLLEAVVAGALMPMLPGLAMTNAVSDTLRGDMMSGLSHFAQAVLTAGLVAGGALIATTCFRMLGGVGV